MYENILHKYNFTTKNFPMLVGSCYTPALPQLLLPYILVYVVASNTTSNLLLPAISSACGAISSINAHHTRLVKLFCSIWSVRKLFDVNNFFVLDEKKRITLCCTNSTPYLQWKLPSVFTNNNKDQSEWRICQINHSRRGIYGLNNPHLWAMPPSLVWTT